MEWEGSGGQGPASTSRVHQPWENGGKHTGHVQENEKPQAYPPHFQLFRVEDKQFTAQVSHHPQATWCGCALFAACPCATWLAVWPSAPPFVIFSLQPRSHGLLPHELISTNFGHLSYFLGFDFFLRQLQYDTHLSFFHFHTHIFTGTKQTLPNLKHPA